MHKGSLKSKRLEQQQFRKRKGRGTAKCRLPSQTKKITHTKIRKGWLYTSTDVSVCKCTEMEAFLLGASGEKSANRARAPTAADLTLNP